MFWWALMCIIVCAQPRCCGHDETTPTKGNNNNNNNYIGSITAAFLYGKNNNNDNKDKRFRYPVDYYCPEQRTPINKAFGKDAYCNVLNPQCPSNADCLPSINHPDVSLCCKKLVLTTFIAALPQPKKCAIGQPLKDAFGNDFLCGIAFGDACPVNYECSSGACCEAVKLVCRWVCD